MIRGAAVAICLIVASGLPIQAQQADVGPPATIVVAASGSVEVVPDHALLVLGVEVRDSVAALAAREMDRRLVAVGDTLAALGFPWDSLPNAGFAVVPDYRYGDEADSPPVYRAASSVRVTVRELERLPDIVTAALGAGANSIRQLEFRSVEEEEARLEALDRAVAAAIGDARRLARAAGVELGEIVEIRTVPGGRSYARGFDGAIGLQEIVVRGGSSGAGITPETITVAAQVQLTWAIR